jgi:hypothetical protein
MTGWSIGPEPVRTIIAKAEIAQQTLVTVRKNVESHDATSTTPGADAIGEFFRSRVPGLRWIDERITAVTVGASGALQAYEDGDELMAGQHQRAAATIGALPPMPRPRPQAPGGMPIPQ